MAPLLNKSMFVLTDEDDFFFGWVSYEEPAIWEKSQAKTTPLQDVKPGLHLLPVRQCSARIFHASRIYNPRIQFRSLDYLHVQIEQITDVGFGGFGGSGFSKLSRHTFG